MPESRRRITRPPAARSRPSRWRDWPPWIDRLSNWQFAVGLASFYILCYAAYVGVSDLAGWHVNLRYLIPQAVSFTVVFTAFAAWKRWK
jgi:hypothetical protein